MSSAPRLLNVVRSVMTSRDLCQNSSDWLADGKFICTYRNGAADVQEFFNKLGWSSRLPPTLCRNCQTQKSSCCCVAKFVANLEPGTFYWTGISNASFALCSAASKERKPLCFNRIPWIRLVANKAQLASTCLRNNKLRRHVPVTFIVNRDTDRQTLPLVLRRLMQWHPAWIVKPASYAKGIGIRLAFKKDGVEDFIRSINSYRFGSEKVVQSYIMNPMLLNNRKFDLRVFVLLVGTGSGLAAFYHSGYVRLALNPFNVNDKSDMTVHLTNQAVQAKLLTYKSKKETTTCSANQMNDWLNQSDSKAFHNDWTLNELHPCIRELMQTLVETLVLRVRRAKSRGCGQFPCRNTFSLLGADILLDANGKPWIIEMNADPALSRQTSTLTEMLPRITTEAFALALEIINSCSNDVHDFTTFKTMRDFEFIGHFKTEE